MNELGNVCVVGQCSKDVCDSNLKILTTEDMKLLSLRLPNLENVPNGHICQHHSKRFLQYFSSYETKCVDPLKKHRQNVINNLREIDLQLAEDFKVTSGFGLIPGKKICTNCLKEIKNQIAAYKENLNCCIDPFQRHRQKVSAELLSLDENSFAYLQKIVNQEYKPEQKVCSACKLQLESRILQYKENIEVPSNKQCPVTHISTPEEITDHDTPGSEYKSDSQHKRLLDTYLETFNMPPFKRQKLSDSRVIKQGVEILQNIVAQVSEVFEESAGVEIPSALKNVEKLHEKNLEFDSIISNLQKKYRISTYDQKLDILNLLPDEWALSKVTEYFYCTPYMLKQAKKLKLQGPTYERSRKKYYRVSQEIRKEIIDFYLDDSNSVACSGMKQCKKVNQPDGTSVPIPKKILLYDLRMLYKMWAKETKQEKIPCFAFFCELKPDECVYAGDPGTHNICVCDKHQNLKLKAAAGKLKNDYTEVIGAGVCSILNKKCMLEECDSCPGKDAIREYLTSQIKIDNTKPVHYSNWTSAAIVTSNSESSSNTRMTLKDFEEPYAQFVDNLIEDVWDIRKHHFISCQQKKYFSDCKKNLAKGTGMIVMDFAENYSFICQNSAQGFYFNNTQASLFTATLYYKSEDNKDTHVASYCVISDSMKHQAFSVHAFQEAVVERIKTEFPWIEKLIYFSDGAPTQFKNKNNFINVCHHEKDFGIKIISYNFFATSHGKSASDGIGATTKQSTRRASLQNVKILDAKAMYNYLNEKESSIRFCYVSAKDVDAREKKLAKRFKTAKTIPNTRDYHRFEPINEGQMVVRPFSNDTDVTIVTLT